MGKLRRTKIICTLGPACDSKDMIWKLAENGMNVVRLNFSHGSQEYFAEKIDLIREVSEESGINLAVLLDTKGPEIRIGEFEGGSASFEQDQLLVVTNEEVVGTNEKFTIRCKEFFDDLKPNDSFLIDDGKMQFTVMEKQGNDFVVRCDNPGVLKNKKSINVPDVHINMKFLSRKDEADIRFGCAHDVDYIAASFTRCADDINTIRRICLEEGKSKLKIYAKIENQEGFDNLEEILDVADGIMVARGDLGVEIKSQLVPIYQKKMIQMANAKGKPVITATHMLESMIHNPRPTRAETSDVANAVLDGSDAIMLSGETASGSYPVESVRTMDTIARSMEDIYAYRDYLDHAKQNSNNTIQDCIGISVADSCLTLDKIKAIIVFTQGGSTARILSKYRPSVPIIAVTFTKTTLRNLQLHWDVFPVYSKIMNDMQNDDELASAYAKLFGIKQGEQVIISAGYPTGEGTANMMKIIEVK